MLCTVIINVTVFQNSGLTLSSGAYESVEVYGHGYDDGNADNSYGDSPLPWITIMVRAIATTMDMAMAMTTSIAVTVKTMARAAVDCPWPDSSISVTFSAW